MPYTGRATEHRPQREGPSWRVARLYSRPCHPAPPSAALPGVPATIRSTRSSTSARNADDLLEVVHDMEALKSRSAAAWIKLFDERYLRTPGPTARACGARRSGCSPTSATRTSCRCWRGGRTCSGPSATGGSIGLGDLWVKQCGVSHTGSFKDLGMTVLVSTVKQMIADGKPIRAVACASTGDTSAALAAYGAAAGIRSMVILPRGKVSTAQLVQPLANGADRAGRRRRLRRLHGDGQAPGRGGGRSTSPTA